MGHFDKYTRYQRQVLLKELGKGGQDKLFSAKVLVVGAGGLGCPVLQYLAGAGVGTIGIVDFDFVELSNLHRQTLYNVDDIGQSKAQRAAEKLNIFNPEIQIHAHCIKLENANALEMMGGYDIVIDGTDNFATRYLINDACVLLGKPLVYGAILRFEGQVAVFNLAIEEFDYKTSYRDLFPVPPDASTVPTCNEAGVLGVLPGVIGTIQASEVIKIITGIGTPLLNTVLSYNILNNSFYEFNISPVTEKTFSMPHTVSEFENFDYDWFCRTGNRDLEISAAEFEQLRNNEDITIIDVREPGELPVVDEFSFTSIPLSNFEKSVSADMLSKKTLLFCLTGKRSLKAARIVQEKFVSNPVFSLKGGIEEWKRYIKKGILEKHN